jgi:hypothetical protein
MNATFTTTGSNGGEFEAQQAAALLNQTTQQAKRQLEPFPPWLVAIRAFLQQPPQLPTPPPTGSATPTAKQRRNSPPRLGPAETTGQMSYPCEKLGG